MTDKLNGLRRPRIFSEVLKKKIVKDLEMGIVSVCGVSREYSVSRAGIYKWLNKYSRYLHSTEKLVLQMDSESYKTKELEKRVQELEAALGRKQLEVDFLNRLLLQGKEELGVDLKKKSFTPRLPGSEQTKGRTDTK